MNHLGLINDPQTIDKDFIEEELKAGREIIVQFSDETYDDKKLTHLNELCRKHNNNFGVRFYGHYSTSFDFKTLLKISDVKWLQVNCLTNAHNLEALAQLQYLQKLSLGVFELKETEILNAANLNNLSELIITETRTKAFNLQYLEDYKNLKVLTIGGHTKNIEAVGELEHLEFLSFNSLKKTPVPFVNKLKKLKTLKFILGGRVNIHEIEENEIETLEIVWVRGFNDISNICNFRNLRNLLIEDNIQLQEIHFEKKLNYLDDLKIYNCKTLNSLKGFENLPSLQQLRIVKTSLAFDQVISQPLPKSLKVFTFYTAARQKVDKDIKDILEKKGYRER
jgi:protein phosphatase 1 regulatory subunit 7